MSQDRSDSQCPLCFQHFPRSVLERHASQCTGEQDPTEVKPKTIPPKRSPEPLLESPPFSAKKFKPNEPKKFQPLRQLEKGSSSASSSSSGTSSVPLAEQMRPQSLDDYLGQDEVTGPKSIWKRLLESDRLPSLVLWGPPGCGKTSLAHVIAQKCQSNPLTKFVKLSATHSGVNDVKDVVKNAKNDMKMFKKRTVLFIDEIHRFLIEKKEIRDSSILILSFLSLVGSTSSNRTRSCPT